MHLARATDQLAPFALDASLIAQTLRIVAWTIKAAAEQTLLKEMGPKLNLMDKVASTLLKGDLDAERGLDDRYHLRKEAEGAGLRELHALLLELDPQRRWGGLKRVLAKTGDYLWLCPNHYEIYEPPLPKLP